MKEIITGLFENNGNNKLLQLKAILREDLGRIGTEGDIGFYNLYSMDGLKLMTREPVCIKKVNEGIIRRCPEAGIGEVQKKWKALKKEGLSVSPFLLTDKENNLLVTQDYTHGGVFGAVDKHNTLATFGHNIANIEEIRRKSIDIGTRALFRSGIFLYQDAYVTVIDREKFNGRVLLSDIGRESYFDNYGYTKADVEEQVNYFISWLVA